MPRLSEATARDGFEPGQLSRPVDAFFGIKVRVENPRADRLSGRDGDQRVWILSPPCFDLNRIGCRVLKAVITQRRLATRKSVIAGKHRPAVVTGDGEGCNAGFRETLVRVHASRLNPNRSLHRPEEAVAVGFGRALPAAVIRP